MTQQLADARAAVERSMGEVDAARAQLQTILDNLTAGVLVLDTQGTLLSANPGASRILRLPLAEHIGQPLAQVAGLAELAAAVQAQFDALRAEHDAPDAPNVHDMRPAGHWQQPFELHGAAGATVQHPISLILRGAVLPGGAHLLVFDDITDIVSAQRAQAWGEVARRLATRNYKNPLHPHPARRPSGSP